MSLTTTQQQALKADILADHSFDNVPHGPDGGFAIAAAYNLIAVPNFFVWRTSVTINEIMVNGFDWTRVDNLTVGKARIWEWMTQLGTVNPSEPNVIAGVLATFTATADMPNRNAVFGHFQRLATRFEKLFATGSGTSSTDQGVGPGLMAVEGPLTSQTVQTVMGW
jgi:hypothetical protein